MCGCQCRRRPARVSCFLYESLGEHPCLGSLCMPFFSRYDPKDCEASLRGLETSLVEKTEKLRKVRATLELQICDLLPEREGAAQTLGGRCCQIPRQMKAYDLLAMQCRLLYERMADINQSKV
ncbi:hypothetical protein FOZ63_024155, partial [Perkinsus olseni]